MSFFSNDLHPPSAIPPYKRFLFCNHFYLSCQPSVTLVGALAKLNTSLMLIVMKHLFEDWRKSSKLFKVVYFFFLNRKHYRVNTFLACILERKEESTGCLLSRKHIVMRLFLAQKVTDLFFSCM